MTKPRTATYSAARIANRVRSLGRQISRDYQGRKLDVVVTMDRSFMFAADLIRGIKAPMVLHFVDEDIRDITLGGKTWREVFFGNRSATGGDGHGHGWKGHDILVVDSILDSGVTQEFLLRRIGEGKPRSVRLAVLLDKTSRRRVALEPDYFGFQTASNEVWSGYGLAGMNGTGRNERYLIASGAGRSRKAGRPAKKR